MNIRGTQRFRSARGQSMTEYAMLLALIGIVLIVMMSLLGGAVKSVYAIVETGIVDPSSLNELIPTPTASPETQEQKLRNCTSVDITAAEYGVNSNSEWAPYRCSEMINNIEMVLSPKGCFQMGNDALAVYFEPGNATQHIGVGEGGRQCFDQPFWLDLYEVQQLGTGKMPVESIDWLSAKSSCESRTARLPTEREWEYAVRGPSGELLGLRADHPKTIQPVGSAPDDVSWVGALDMLGNVSEWTGTIYRVYSYDATDGRESPSASNQLAFRGGSNVLYDYPQFQRAATRNWYEAIEAHVGLGYRCAKNFERPN